MRSFADVTARVLAWNSDGGSTIPDQEDIHFALYAAQELVATAHVTWLRQRFFDVTMESADGAYQSHMDLTRNDRPTLVFKSGEDSAMLAWTVAWEQTIACGGPITTREGRKLLLEPTVQMSAEYAVFPEGGARILTLAAWAKISIGGSPGHMSIEPSSATDPDLAALVLLAFTVANEETRLLHRGRM